MLPAIIYVLKVDAGCGMFDGRMETFIKVAECGSFTKAADDLYITPTAVMKQINALEKELEVTLFDRTNRGLRSALRAGIRRAGRATVSCT